MDYFLGLDDFKHYDSVLGDFVFKYLGNIVKGILRKVDYTFRLGDEEFAVIMPNVSLADVRFLNGLKKQCLHLKT